MSKSSRKVRVPEVQEYEPDDETDMQTDTSVPTLIGDNQPPPDTKVAVSATIDALRQSQTETRARSRKEQEHAYAFMILEANGSLLYNWKYYLPGTEHMIVEDGAATKLTGGKACMKQASTYLLDFFDYSPLSGSFGDMDTTGTRVAVKNPGRITDDRLRRRYADWIAATKQVADGCSLMAQLSEAGVEWIHFDPRQKMFRVPIRLLAGHNEKPVADDPETPIMLDGQLYGMTDSMGKSFRGVTASVKSIRSAWLSRKNKGKKVDAAKSATTSIAQRGGYARDDDSLVAVFNSVLVSLRALTQPIPGDLVSAQDIPPLKMSDLGPKTIEKATDLLDLLEVMVARDAADGRDPLKHAKERAAQKAMIQKQAASAPMPTTVTSDEAIAAETAEAEMENEKLEQDEQDIAA